MLQSKQTGGMVEQDTQEVKAESIVKPNLAWVVQGGKEGEVLVACQVLNGKESRDGIRGRGDGRDIPKPKDPNMVNRP